MGLVLGDGGLFRGSGDVEHLCQRFVLVGLLMLEEPVQPVGLDNALGLVREEYCVPIEGHAELVLGHSYVPAGAEDGGSCNPCTERGQCCLPGCRRRCHMHAVLVPPAAPPGLEASLAKTPIGSILTLVVYGYWP